MQILQGFTTRPFKCFRTEIDECATNPCVHGTCTDQVDAFLCTCDPGWTAPKCDIGMHTSRQNWPRLLSAHFVLQNEIHIRTNLINAIIKCTHTPCEFWVYQFQHRIVTVGYIFVWKSCKIFNKKFNILRRQRSTSANQIRASKELATARSTATPAPVMPAIPT